MTQSTNQGNDHLKNLNLLLYFCFFVSGISTVLVGQVLPVLSQRFSLGDEQSARFFTAQLAGSLLGNLINGRISARYGLAASSAFGCFAMGLGVLGLNSGVWEVCLAAFVVNGIGIGTTLPSVNMLIAETHPQNTNYALNLLNFFWGFGAILCKPFVDYTGYGGSILVPMTILSITLLCAGTTIAFAPARQKLSDAESSDKQTSSAIWTSPVAWLIAFFTFVHVGFEFAIGGWITTYTIRLSGDGSATWLSPTFIYFLFFVLGRGFSPLLALRLKENTMLFTGIFIIFIGVLQVINAESFNSLLFAASISGFGTSWIFPTNMSRFTKIFGDEAARKAGPLFMAGSLGSAFTSYLVGYISTSSQNLRSGMYILLISCGLLIVIQTLLLFLPQKTNGVNSMNSLV